MATTCTKSEFLSFCKEGNAVKVKKALDEVRSDASAMNDLLNCTSDYPSHDWMPEFGGGKLFEFKPLHYACAFGHHEVARMLVDAGSPFEWVLRGTRASNITSLHLASFFVGNVDLVKFILDVGAMSMIDLTNSQSSNGATPLMMAALGGHDKVASLLLEAGAVIDIQANDGRTALMIAAEEDNFEVGSLLIGAGADLNCQDKCGQTVLMKTLDALEQRQRRGGYRRKNEKRQREVGFYLAQVRVLVESGAQVNVRDKRGQTALIMVTSGGHDEIANILVGAGADVNVQAHNGRNALMIAANEENLEVMRMLISAGAHLNFQDNDGETALMRAVCPVEKECYRGDTTDGYSGGGYGYGYNDSTSKKDIEEEGSNLEQVSVLLEAGALVDLQNKKGETALIKAAKVGAAKIARALLDAGAKADISDNTCRTAMKWARERQHRNAVKLFRSYHQTRGAAAPAATAAQPPASGAPEAHPGSPPPPPLPPGGSSATAELDALGRVFQEALGAARARAAAAEAAGRRAAAAAAAEAERGKVRALGAELAGCRGELERAREEARAAAAEAAAGLKKAQEAAVRAALEASLLKAELGHLKGEFLGEMGLAEAEGLERDLQGFLAAARRRREALVKERLESAAASVVCVVCQENGKCVLTLPCRHLCLCQGYSENEQLKVCPLCRTEIESKIQTFL